jgi:hypothetical protein
MGGLFGVQGAEQLVGGLHPRGLRHVPRVGWKHPAEDLDGGSVLVGFQEGVEGFQCRVSPACRAGTAPG